MERIRESTKRRSELEVKMGTPKGYIILQKSKEFFCVNI